MHPRTVEGPYSCAQLIEHDHLILFIFVLFSCDDMLYHVYVCAHNTARMIPIFGARHPDLDERNALVLKAVKPCFVEKILYFLNFCAIAQEFCVAR